MNISGRKKIIYAVVAILIAIGGYYFSGNKQRLENTGEKQTEKIPDVSNSDNLPDSGEDKVASGTYENSGGSEKTPSAPTPKEETPVAKSVLFDVPFTSQAPFGNWSDPRKQDGCEEAAVIMAMAWVRGNALDAKSVDEEINNIAKYEEDAIGTFHDTSAFDTVQVIFKGYFKYDKVSVKYRIKKEDIINELMAGNLVIVPAKGQLLGNPNYTPPGPLTHNLVVIGYDVKTKEFITNDPGTRKGKGFRYDEDILINAVFDYPTGSHEKATEEKTVMVIVSKE